MDRLDRMTGGWFIGNFLPSVWQTSEFEVCIKRYVKGESEPVHFQKSSTEITVIIEGSALMGTHQLSQGDIIVLAPLEECSFIALSDVTLVAVKLPSLPNDKVIS